MSYVSLILGIINIIQTLLRWGHDNKMFNEGAKAEVAKALLTTSRMVADAKAIEEWVVSQPDVSVNSLLQRYYTRDK